MRPTWYPAVLGGESVIRLSLGKLHMYWLAFCKWSNGLTPREFLNNIES